MGEIFIQIQDLWDAPRMMPTMNIAAFTLLFTISTLTGGRGTPIFFEGGGGVDAHPTVNCRFMRGYTTILVKTTGV